MSENYDGIVLVRELDDDSDLEEYEQRTFKADARIFHKDAWTTKVPRDRSIVTLLNLTHDGIYYKPRLRFVFRAV